jgi:hypothetical protein
MSEVNLVSEEETDNFNIYSGMLYLDDSAFNIFSLLQMIDFHVPSIE